MPSQRKPLKWLLDTVFGPSGEQVPAAHAPSTGQPDPEFSQDVLEEVGRIRSGVKQHFDEQRAKDEAALGLLEKKQRLERAQTFLRKAGIEPMFSNILRHTWHWDAWKEKGELDDLPRYGLEVTAVRPKQPTGTSHHQTKGYSITIAGRAYDVDFLDKGRGYTPDGYGDRYGEVTVAREGELVFACSMDERSTEYTSDWKLSIWGLRVLKDVLWLPDFAEFSEIVEQRSRKRQEEWNAKRLIEQAAEIVDPVTDKRLF